MNSLITSHQQAGGKPSPGKSGSITCKLLGRTKRHCYKYSPPPFLLLPPALYAECDVIWHGISLWSVSVSYHRCVPSQFLVHLSLLVDRAVWKAEKALAS